MGGIYLTLTVCMEEFSDNVTLKEQYINLCEKIGIETGSNYGNLSIHIRHILKVFMSAHKRVAVYCYGKHTKMLFTDFIADLRDIVCIIDNGDVQSNSKFQIIKDSEAHLCTVCPL